MNETTNIHADRGAVVGYKSMLTHVRTMYQTSSDQSPEAQNVKNEIEAFAQKLGQVDEKHADEAQVLSQRLDELAKQATKLPEHARRGFLNSQLRA